MLFAMSYSGGKDSALALDKMLKAGHRPVAMITTINKQLSRSWFHGIDNQLLSAIAKSLGIPLLLSSSDGQNYHTSFKAALWQAKQLSAEACVFGDIDIEEHLAWNKERCNNVGLACELPLWQMSREQVMEDFLSSGLLAAIKCIQNDKLAKNMLGRTLDKETVRLFRMSGIDICGENGEYHTIAYGGPIFRHTVPLHHGEILDFGSHSAIDITLGT